MKFDEKHSKMNYVVNPDSASKRIHYIPNSDGRCKLDKIKNPIKFKNLQSIDQTKYPNKCKICMS